MTQSALVVLEFGAEWPGSYVAADATDDASATVSQRQDEPLGRFVDRALACFAARGQQNLSPTRVVVACSDRMDESAVSARRVLGRSILAAFADLGQGSLLFAESQRKSCGSRQALSDLATDLEHEFEDDPVRVSVRFGEPSRPPMDSVRP